MNEQIIALLWIHDTIYNNCDIHIVLTEKILRLHISNNIFYALLQNFTAKRIYMETEQTALS